MLLCKLSISLSFASINNVWPKRFIVSYFSVFHGVSMSVLEALQCDEGQISTFDSLPEDQARLAEPVQ